MDKIAKRALAKCKPLFPNRPLELHGHLRPDEILALSKLKEVHPHNQHQVIWAEDYVKNGSMVVCGFISVSTASSNQFGKNADSLLNIKVNTNLAGWWNLVDTRDLKSLGDYLCAGSIPAPATNQQQEGLWNLL
jgi:hypothetical protein